MYFSDSNFRRVHPARRRFLTTLADQLGIDQRVVFSGDAMSKARYEKYRDDIGYAHNDLSRQLTREALSRAGLCISQ